jgi:hypothetical protein
MPQAELGVFGGSGFYSFLEDVEQVEVETPYGRPSAPVAIGEIADKRVAFLPRHGLRHELPPARIPYRANVWALRRRTRTASISADCSSRPRGSPGSRRATAARSLSSRGRASPPAPSPSGTARSAAT